MLLIIGGAYQGKLDFALELTKYKEKDFADGASCPLEEIYTAKGINHFHEYIRRLLERDGSVDAEAFAKEIGERNPGLVLISNELGYGIVPVDPRDRLWRETTGRVCTRLAGQAEQVYRVVCGLGTPLRTGRLRLMLVRHGKTEGNRKNRYIGVTDEALCSEGAAELTAGAYPQPQIGFVSPMKRCLETMELISDGTADQKTAELFTPGMEGLHCCIVPDFRECDFGIFENKNYQELAGCPEYQQWIDSNGTLSFPGGENSEFFRERCCQAFEQVVQWLMEHHYTSAGLVVHGGTIMSIMERYALPGKDYYDWHVKNGEGYRICLDEKEWREKKCFSLSGCVSFLKTDL